MIRGMKSLEDDVHRLLLLSVICCCVFGCSKQKDDATGAMSSGPKADNAPEVAQIDPGDDGLPSGETVPPDNSEPPLLSPAPPQKSRNELTAIRVFYGTDRQPTGSEKLNEFYGGNRGSLSVGFCDVSIPPNHKRGKLEAPSIWRFEIRENPNRHVMLRSVQPVDGATFVNSLRTAVSSSIRKSSVANEVAEIGGELFVFVHGYNVTFKDAARRTAQMAYDLGFPGVPVMFSWPSLGEGNLAGYREDERSAEWCEEDVMDFVTVIAEQSGARRIHLIAHSMGNRVLTGVLRRLAYSHRSGNVPKFNEVILMSMPRHLSWRSLLGLPVSRIVSPSMPHKTMSRLRCRA